MLDLPQSRWRAFALVGVAVFFIVAGVNHFLNPDFYLAMMPPYLPAHRLLVALSGVFEVLGGLAVLPRRTRAAAGWGLMVLLVAVFPANLHMALYPALFPGVSVWALYARLPLQLVFIVWTYWATRPEPSVSVAA